MADGLDEDRVELGEPTGACHLLGEVEACSRPSPDAQEA
jgi:hypothetical protein